MTRSTDSRRARNSASVRIGGAPPTGLATLAAPLLLGLQAGRAADRLTSSPSALVGAPAGVSRRARRCSADRPPAWSACLGAAARAGGAGAAAAGRRRPASVLGAVVLPRRLAPASPVGCLGRRRRRRRFARLAVAGLASRAVGVGSAPRRPRPARAPPPAPSSSAPRRRLAVVRARPRGRASPGARRVARPPPRPASPRGASSSSGRPPPRGRAASAVARTRGPAAGRAPAAARRPAAVGDLGRRRPRRLREREHRLGASGRACGLGGGCLAGRRSGAWRGSAGSAAGSAPGGGRCLGCRGVGDTYAPRPGRRRGPGGAAPGPGRGALGAGRVVRAPGRRGGSSGGVALAAGGTRRRPAGWPGRLAAAAVSVCWRAGAAALVTAGSCIGALGLEHPGDLPSGSRARRGPHRGPSAPRGSWSHAAPPGARVGRSRLRLRARVVSTRSVPLRRATVAAWPARHGRRGSPGTSGPGAQRGRWPPPSPSGPCASRVTSGGDDGTSPATGEVQSRMSSGRTAGVTCRTTIRSIAYPAFRSSASHQSASHREHRGASVHAPHSLAGQALDLHAVRARNVHGACRLVSPDPGERDLPPGRLAVVAGQANRPPRSRRSRQSRPAGPHRAGPAASGAAHAAVSAISRYSASLAAPVGAAPA